MTVAWHSSWSEQQPVPMMMKTRESRKSATRKQNKPTRKTHRKNTEGIGKEYFRHPEQKLWCFLHFSLKQQNVTEGIRKEYSPQEPRKIKQESRKNSGEKINCRICCVCRGKFLPRSPLRRANSPRPTSCTRKEQRSESKATSNSRRRAASGGSLSSLGVPTVRAHPPKRVSQFAHSLGA